MNIDLRVYDEVKRKQFISYLVDWCSIYHKKYLITVPIGVGMAY